MAARSRSRSWVGIQAVEWLRGDHLDWRRIRFVGGLRGLARHILGIVVLFLREPSVALRDEPVDLRPQLATPLVVLRSQVSQDDQHISSLTVSNSD